MNQKIGNQAALQQMAEQDTGIPAAMKAKAEERSGLSMDQVRVHYQSPLPKQVGAQALTQGTQVYVGPGQEKYLGHELGHVVQQMKGKVRPTGTVQGRPVNDDISLEREADRFLM